MAKRKCAPGYVRKGNRCVLRKKCHKGEFRVQSVCTLEKTVRREYISIMTSDEGSNEDDVKVERAESIMEAVPKDKLRDWNREAARIIHRERGIAEATPRGGVL